MKKIKPIQKVSLLMIGRELGLSTAAVSMAMKNNPRISLATRIKVQKLAKKLDYKPDPHLSKLMGYLKKSQTGKKTETIALVTAYKNPSTWKESFLTQIREGVKDRAEQLGFTVESFNIEYPHITATRLCEILIARGIRGVVLAPLRENRRHLSFKYQNFALSTASEAYLSSGIHSTGVDNYHNTLFIMHHLKKLGYSRVAFVSNEELDLRSEFRFWAAYHAAVARYFRGQNPLCFFYRDFAGKEFKTWFQRERPECIVTTEPLVYQWLKEMGVSVPKEVGLALTSVQPDRFDSPISGMNENAYLQGSASVDLVVAQLQRGEIGIPPYQKKLLVHGNWTGNFTVSKRRSS